MRIHRAVMLAVSLLTGAAFGEAIPDRNVNMVSGTTWPGGDPYLQRQNEPSIAVSTRNPLHLLAGSNDYRTVDIPGLENIKVIGDAWLGVYRSYDGGSTWTSTLLPGYPQDTSLAGMSSPLKGYPAGADPVVRAGANGLFYYAGIVLSREENPLGGVFVARYLDHNDKESRPLDEDGHSIRYVDSRFLQIGTSGQFHDKPWLAVDTPRAGSAPCNVNGETVAGGNAYVAWTTFVGGDENIRSKMMIARSTDCGATWNSPIKLSESHAINQGSSIAIDPTSGNVYVVWRRISNGKETNALLFAKSTDFGRTFSQTQVLRNIYPFEQGTTPLSFRTTMFPSITVDGNGRIYVVWSERTPGGFEFGRIALISSSNGVDWSDPQFVANSGPGHQFMPTISFAHGKLTLAWYDQAEDHTTGLYTPIIAPDGTNTGQYSETRVNKGHRADDTLIDLVFNRFVQEIGLGGTALLRRHTVDVFAAQADPGVMPLFVSRRASQYYFGSRPEPDVNGDFLIEQMQYNPANLPLFRQGTVPFLGDYIDVATAGPNVRHVVWTDNRDVRPPLDGDWRNYTPPASAGGASKFDPTLPTPQCVGGQAGMRNQNIYTTRITNGLFAGSPGNTKPFLYVDENGAVHPLQRAFVVFVQNALRETRTYRLRIASQPVNGTASFLQFDPLDTLDVAIPARSSIARTVFATSAVKYDEIEVIVEEITSTGTPVPDGLSTTVVLNPDIANPDIANPDIANPDIANPDIANAEVYNPDIANPDIANPDIANPDIANPDIANPDIANPDIANPDIANPDIANPDIANPDIANPDIANPDIANGSVTDTTWETTNEGNTVATYSVNLLLNGQVPDAFKLQLIIHRIYTTPIANPDCTLGVERHTVLAANINDPEFTAPGDLAENDVTDSSEKNATVYILPGETIRITLRVVDPNRFDDITFNAAEEVTPVVVAHAINTENLEGRQLSISLAIITTRIPDAITGTSYSTELEAIGGTGERTWTIGSAPLPPGLSLNSAGVVSGVATLAGQGTFTAIVQDSVSPEPHRHEAKITTRVVDPLTVNPEQALTDAIGGRAYLQPLSASGGVAPYTWSVSAGELPSALTLATDGTITGTPAVTGTYDFTAEVVDATFPPQSRSLALSLRILPPPDLIVETVNHTPANPTTGDVITFTALVKNVGGSTAESSALAFSIGGDGSDARPTFDVPALAPNETHTTVRQLVISTAGSYESTATADFTNLVMESNEENNATLHDFTVSVVEAPAAAFGSAVNTAAGTAPEGIAAGDLNGDGRLDLVTANFHDGGSGSMSVLLGTGGGAFAPATHLSMGMGPRDVKLGDLDGDGDLDAVVANLNDGTLSIRMNQGNGTFGGLISIPATGPNNRLALADLDNDDILDIAVTKSDRNAVAVLLGNGDGSFGAQTLLGAGTFAWDVGVADLNEDGLSDLIVSNRDSMNVSLLLGAGEILFGTATNFAAVPKGTEANLFGMALGDVDGDGDVDIALASNAGSIMTLQGVAAVAGFLPPVARSSSSLDQPLALAFGELNADSHQDLVVANFDRNALTLLIGNGTPGFGTLIDLALASGSRPTDVVLADLNGDGMVDIAATDRAGNRVAVLINATTLSGHLTDRSGDATGSGPDLISAKATKDGGTLSLEVRFVPLSFNPSSTFVQFLLDNDQNPATGHPGSDAGGTNDAGIIGTEHIVEIGPGGAVIKRYEGTPNSFSFVQSIGVTTLADGYSVSVPLPALQNDDGKLNFKLVSSTQLSPTSWTGIQDRMTEIGFAPGVVPRPTASWSELDPLVSEISGMPPPRGFHGTSAVYDPSSNRLIVFGGMSSTFGTTLNDVWLLTAANGEGRSAWINLIPNAAEGSPPPRAGHTAVYDSANNRMIVFGGCNAACMPVLDDTWVLSNANGLGGTPSWTQIRASGIPPRSMHTAVYDAGANRMIVYGGHDGATGNLDVGSFSDVWVLPGANGLGAVAAWTQLTPDGALPGGRVGARAVYDAASNRVILTGGIDAGTAAAGDGQPTNAVWALSLAGASEWISVVPEDALGSPPKVSFHNIAYNSSTNRLTLFGGGASTPWVLSNANGLGGPSGWTALCPAGTTPPRSSHGADYDQATDRMIIFGGGSGDVRNDSFILRATTGGSGCL